MKVLLTGATGFVGAAVLRRLADRGDDVKVLIRPTSDRRNLGGLNCEICVGDLNDPASLETALKDCQALFHVAADYRLWAQNPAEITESNVNGTQNIMTAALATGIEKIVYTSSVATLGINSDETPGDEETPSSLDTMTGIYKKSKYIAEQNVLRMVREKALPAIIVNPSAPIGPRDIKPTPTGHMIVQAARGEMPAYVDTGLNVVHVDDVARGHILAFENGIIGERYILGGEDMTLKAILQNIAQMTGKVAPKICLPHNAILPMAYIAEAWAKLTRAAEPFATVDGINMAKKKMYFSSAKAQKAIGYTYRPAKEALQDAIKWFGENGYLN